MNDRHSILVIDDEPDNFDVIQMLLSGEPYLFHYASSGQRALDRVDIFQPDMILLDVMMPQLDGIEVCRRIKTSSQWQMIPVVMVSALTEISNIERCLNAGADDFIAKPVKRSELMTKVAALLKIQTSPN
jgi:two-component system, sensor histidine kinase and response regulator